MTDVIKKCVKKIVPLGYDEACLDIVSTYSTPIRVNGRYEECQFCEPQKIVDIPANTTSSILLQTAYPFKINFNDGQYEWCNTIYQYEEHGMYGWNISAGGRCSYIYIKSAPDNAYLPILGAFILFLLFGTIWYGIKCMYRSGCTSSIRHRLARFSELENDLGSPQIAPPTAVPPSQRRPGAGRVKSLDVFRGLAITIMIFVNYGGGQYSFFKHSVWNGLTVADLVFPWFAWIMGVSIAFSLRASLRAGVSRKRLISKAIHRCMILVVLGIALNTAVSYISSPTGIVESFDVSLLHTDHWGTEGVQIRHPSDISNLRIPGVLQRLGIVGLIVSIMEISFMKVQSELLDGYLRVFSDILESWMQWIAVFVMVAVHTCITFLMYVPDCPTGYLGPGGLHERGTHWNCTGGAAGYIDKAVFGPSHLYQRPSCATLYKTTTPYDPEGLLGILTTVLIVYLGVQSGRIMQTYNSPQSRLIRWFAWAVITGLAAGFLCGFSKNDGHIPVNKNLWSLSYVLATASMAFIMQAILYILIDVTHHWGGRPLFYPGMNPIFLYIGHILTKNMFPWAWSPVYSSHREFLFMNLWGTFVWIAIAVFLYKKRVILRL